MVHVNTDPRASENHPTNEKHVKGGVWSGLDKGGGDGAGDENRVIWEITDLLGKPQPQGITTTMTSAHTFLAPGEETQGRQMRTEQSWAQHRTSVPGTDVTVSGSGTDPGQTETLRWHKTGGKSLSQRGQLQVEGRSGQAAFLFCIIHDL